MKLKKHVSSCLVGLLAVVVAVMADQFDENTENIVNDLARDRSSEAASAAGPWFSRILGLIGSKDFKGLYQKYIENERDEEAADTTTGVLARRNLSPGPVRQVFVTEPRNKHHHHHHHRRHHHHHNTKVKKWVNVKVINQVGTRVKLKADKILPNAVLSSGEIFVYHELLNGTDQRADIQLRAVDEYTDQPLLLNGETTFTVSPVTYDHTQQAYVTREDSRNGILDSRHGHVLQSLGAGNRWFYVKLINNAAGRVRVTPDQILPSTTLDVDESQVEYARLEPGDEYKRIVLRAVDVRNDEPVKLNGEFTLALRPDDAGDITKVKISRGDTIFATCDNFVPMEGEGNFEFQLSTDDTKSWFDSVRACKLCNAELLSVHSREENDFVTKQLRKASEVHKLWIGMSYKEKVRMWSWTDGSRYRYQNWKEGQHYDGKDEQCGIIYQQYDWGRWDDDNCYKPHGYVCKRHRTKSADSVKSKKSGLSKDKRGCPSVVPDCPSLCSVIKVPGSCPRCDCGSLVKGYGSMSRREREKVRRLFSEANRQMAGLRRAQVEEARAARRSMIMRQAGRLMAESRHLQQLAMMEGIPLNLPFTHGSLRRQEILSPSPDTTESSTKNLAREIVGLIDDIEKTSDDEKKAK